MTKSAYEHEAWFAPDGDAHLVKGFLSPESSSFISRLLTYQLETGCTGSLVEIGTFMGRTFVGLAKAARADERVVGFDLYPDYVRDGFTQALERLTEEQRKAVTAFRKNTLELPTSDWIKMVGQPARFLHIDGGHTYGAIINDLHLGSAFLASGALVILDDFLHDWYPDLTEGIIDGLRASPTIVPIALVPRLGPAKAGGSKLICSTRSSAKEYQDFLAATYADKAPQLRRLAGSMVLTFQGF